MRRHVVFIATLILLSSSVLPAQQNRINVSHDIQLVKLSEHAYVHVSYADMPPFGRVGSNGLVLVNGKEAFLFDTPANDSLTRMLVSYLRDSMGVQIAGFVPNHWHSDCMGGLGYLKSIGVESYANQVTIGIAESKHLPVPDHGFTDSLALNLGDMEIECYYPGPAHSLDNIVVWIPSERILFGGCMVKAAGSRNLGNTADGDTVQYPATIRRILKKYGNARYVIPGHGETGGPELIRHTLELARQPVGN